MVNLWWLKRKAQWSGRPGKSAKMECPTLGKVAAGALMARPVAAFVEGIVWAEPEPNPDEFSQGISRSNAAPWPPPGSWSDRVASIEEPHPITPCYFTVQALREALGQVPGYGLIRSYHPGPLAMLRTSLLRQGQQPSRK